MTEKASNSPGKATVPDLYRLLDLSPLEGDRSRIEQALRQVLKHAKETQQSDPDESKRSARLLELGKQNLLDAKRKAAYDQKWKLAFGAPTVEAVVSEWPLEELVEVLPEGDPNHPFDLSRFLEQSTELPESTSERDFQQLAALLNGDAEAGAASLEAVSLEKSSKQARPVVSTAENPVQTQVFASGANEVAATDSGTSAGPPPLPTKSKNPARSHSIARNIRKKRERSLLFAVGGVLVSLVAVLSVLFLVLQNGKKQKGGESPQVASANPPPEKPTGGNSGQPRKPPSGSGLPQVAGLTAEQADALQNGDMSKKPESTMSSQPLNDGADDNQPNSSNQSAQQSSGSPDTGPPGNGMAMAGGAPPENATSDSEPILTDEDKQNWRNEMLAARRLLGEQKYEEASRQLDQLQEAAKTQQQQAQFVRLKTVASLAQECRQALVEAILGLGAGESFTVGKSTPVSFVEGSDVEVVLRISGRNQRFGLTTIPIGIVIGLVDLKLDLEHPSSLARKAAFILLHPGSNDVTLARAKSMMQTAVAERQVPKGIGAIFEDDYQL